jgi:acetoin utilization protein AcuB
MPLGKVVGDIMKQPVVTTTPTTTLDKALASMLSSRIQRLPVLDENQQLVGIITDRDVRLAADSPMWQGKNSFDFLLIW